MRFEEWSLNGSALQRVTSRALVPTAGLLFWLATSATATADTGAPTATPSASLPLPAPTSTDIVRQVQAWVSTHPLGLWVGYALVAGIVGSLLLRFGRSNAGKRLKQTIEEEVLTNWRLALLGITSLALTLASGWTTWDGMTNFTGTPVLSFLITLGIQGVMLIAAWLIGESFAVGLTGSGPARSVSERAFWVVSIVLLAAAFFALATLLIKVPSVGDMLMKVKTQLGITYHKKLWELLACLVFSIGLTTLMASQKDIFDPYLRGIKVTLKSLPIWLMFLACMLTSVFFSFDSLFSTIFPADERARAAELRTTNQVAGIVSDLGATIARRQVESVDLLFTSPEWAEYSGRINDIIGIARSAPDQIADLTRKELEAQQSERAGLQERKASAESQMASQSKRKDELIAEVSRLKEEVPPIAAEVDRLKAEMFKKDSEILAKKAEMQAEAGGVGGTLKAGQGPEWSKRRKELDDLQKLKAILDGQLKERSAQLSEKRGAVASAEGELAQIDSEIGKLKGEADVADKQIAIASAQKTGTALADTTEAVAATGFASLGDAFGQFRQHPDRKTFEAVQQQCSALMAVFEKVPALKDAVAQKGVRCDPGTVAERAGRVFALQDGMLAFKERCGKPDSLPQTGVDDLLAFGEKCVQTSGLSGQDTALFRTGINSIGLNRDDKAHRFIVTWNAFLDGNHLAYLALGIAFALDGLVFMSGLFGANAVSSPLVRLPAQRKRSAADLEAMMYSALRPDVYGRAKLVLGAMHPIAERDGFVSEIRLADFKEEAAKTIRSVLSVAAQLGAVRPDRNVDSVYQIRGELTEFLSKACERELRINEKLREDVKSQGQAAAHQQLTVDKDFDKARAQEREAEAEHDRRQRDTERRKQRLMPVIAAALGPNVLENAGTVLEQLLPAPGGGDFRSMVIPVRVPQSHMVIVRKVLNAGATLEAVRHDDKGGDERYLIRPELTLCLIELHRDELQKVEAARLREERRWKLLPRPARQKALPPGAPGPLQLTSRLMQEPPPGATQIPMPTTSTSVRALSTAAPEPPPPSRVNGPPSRLEVVPPRAVRAEPQRLPAVAATAEVGELVQLLPFDGEGVSLLSDPSGADWAKRIGRKIDALARDSGFQPLLERANGAAENDFHRGYYELTSKGRSVDAQAAERVRSRYVCLRQLKQLLGTLATAAYVGQDDSMVDGNQRWLNAQSQAVIAIRRFLQGEVGEGGNLEAVIDALEELGSSSQQSGEGIRSAAN